MRWRTEAGHSRWRCKDCRCQSRALTEYRATGIMAKLQPLVSVIIPSYKMGAYIGEALQSVGGQSYRRWEVVVVDDCGPDDGTYDVIKAFRTSFPDHRVECVRHPTNRGVSAARNTAIAAAEGEFLAFLDPDDSWFPDHLF